MTGGGELRGETGGARQAEGRLEVSVVEFVLGPMVACLPASSVRELGSESAVELVHVSDALGFHRRGDEEPERVVLIAAGGAQARALVDGPVTFRVLLPADLLRLPAGLGQELRGPVVAVTERDGDLGYVLDPGLLLEVLSTRPKDKS